MTERDIGPFSPAEVAAIAEGRLEEGRGDARVTHLASPERVVAGHPGADAAVVVAQADDVLGRLAAAPAAPGIVVLTDGLDLAGRLPGVAVVRVADPRLALARLSARFDTRPTPATGERSGSATVHRTATLGLGVTLHAGSVVAPGAHVGDGSVVGPGAVVGAGSVVGADCVLHANVALYDGVTLGDRVVLHAGSVIGADGFGYAASPTGAVKVRHLGGVRIGSDVEVGANTAIDRGTLDDTVIGAGTKVDNLCQIGHNVHVGRSCLIAGMTGIGGSARLGDGVIVGGAVAISDHVTIGAGARIAGRSGVTKDVPAGETWAGFPARPHRQFVRSLYLQERLEDMWRAFRRMGDG